jgi:Ca2+-binding EF-hand superfamily protein
MQDLWKCFKDFETSGAGVVQLDIAISIVERFGISLLTDAVDELLSDLGMQKGTALDFHALVRFLDAARRTHGFSRTEEEELSAAFEKIDYDGTGELNHLQVLDLLRYLGHTTSFEEADSLIRRVDFNMNGSMDRDEFLRLMRLMREQDIRCARKSFNELRSSTGGLPAESVKDALAKLQLFPRLAMIAELLQDNPAEVCFTSFMRLHDRCRFRMSLDLRRRGGFQEDTILEIAELWNCGGSSRQFATVGELLWMFSKSDGVPVSTIGGRHKLLRRVRAAREAAIEAGVLEEDVSRGNTTDIGFYTFVHLIRSLVRDTQQEAITREKEAASFAQFSNSEAAEFRRVFCDFAECKATPSTWNQLAARKGQCVDELLARLTMVPAVPEVAMPLLLRSIGVRVPSSKLQELRQFLARNKSRGEADKNTVQFATFLRLLRWMLDADFAGICGLMDFPRR